MSSELPVSACGLLPSPAPSPSRRFLSRIFGGLGSSSLGREFKGKGKRLLPPIEDPDYPLDGEEGELIDDEACFVDARESIGIDILSYLPYEIALLVFNHLDLAGIIACLAVSRSWRLLALDSQVWRELFLRQPGWKVDQALAIKHQQTPPQVSPSSSSLSRRLSLSFALPSLSSSSRRQSAISAYSSPMTRPLSFGLSDVGPAPLGLDWQALYKERRELELRWTNPNVKPQCKKLVGHQDSVYCLEFDSALDVLITGSRDRSIKIWSMSTGELRHTLKDHHAGSVLCLKFDGAEGFMASGSSDKTVMVWQLNGLPGGAVTGVIKKVLRGHLGGVLDLRIDANWIVSCSKDTVVRVWSRHTLEPHCELSGHTGPVNAVGLQGDHVVSASGDGKMILWDLQTRAKLHTFEGHDRGLACVEFQGDYIISGSNDRKIKIWSASRGECLATLAGHDLLVRALAFDSGLGRLVSASYDKTVKVWEINFGPNNEVTAKGIREFKDHHASHIFDVKFDAGKIVSSSHDEKVVILDFGTDLDTALFI